MVFTIYGNKFHRLTQYLQRIIQLDTFTDRHVCIYRAMQQQQRGINLVRIEQCSMLRKQIGIIPRIAIGCRNRVIGISPITLAPIARYIADASMRGSGSKHVRLSLQIHRHESSIRGTQASDTFIVDKRMGCTEFLRTFNDLIGRTLTPCIDMACRELLAVPDGTTGLDNINHIVT